MQHELDEGLNLQNLAMATVIRSYPENMIAHVQHACNKCESLGSGKQVTLHGNSSEVAKDFFPHMALRRRFVAKCAG